MRASINLDYRKRLITKRIPLTGMLESTNKCNLNCAHCYVWADEHRYINKELNQSQIYVILFS